MNTKILKGLLISATILGIGVSTEKSYAEEITEPKQEITAPIEETEEVIEAMEQTEQVETADVIEATAEVEPAQEQEQQQVIEQEQQIVDENTQEETEDVIEEQAQATAPAEQTLVQEEKEATPVLETPKEVIETTAPEQTANDIKNETKYGVNEAGNYYIKTTGTGKIYIYVGLKEYTTPEGYVGDSSAVYVLYVEDGKILNQELYELLMAEDAYILAEDGVTIELIKVETVTVVEEKEDNSTKEEATEPIDQPNDVDVLEEQAEDTTDEQEAIHSIKDDKEAIAPESNKKEANSWGDITKKEKEDIQKEANAVESTSIFNIIGAVAKTYTVAEKADKEIIAAGKYSLYFEGSGSIEINNEKYEITDGKLTDGSNSIEHTFKKGDELKTFNGNGGLMIQLHTVKSTEKSDKTKEPTEVQKKVAPKTGSRLLNGGAFGTAGIAISLIVLVRKKFPIK